MARSGRVVHFPNLQPGGRLLKLQYALTATFPVRGDERGFLDSTALGRAVWGEGRDAPHGRSGVATTHINKGRARFGQPREGLPATRAPILHASGTPPHKEKACR